MTPQTLSARPKRTTCHRTLALLFASLLCATFVLAEPGSTLDERTEGHILYIPIPADVSKEALSSADHALRNRLRSLAEYSLAAHALQNSQLQEMPAAIDRIIIFVDARGQPILPDLESAGKQPGRVTERVTPPANGLTFTFDSPIYPWSTEELATVNTTLNDCYTIAKVVYGNPAFNIAVNVRKDPTISFAGLYFVSLNEMVVKDTQPDAICHEMIHAFRDDNVIRFGSYEEGMTRAAEVEVFNRLPTYPHFDRNHTYTYDRYYEALNKQAIGARDGNFFAGYVAPLLRYQLGGYAWAKPLLENEEFFVNFNRELYSMALSDPTTLFTESKLIDIAANVQRRVENESFRAWYGRQGVLNSNPPEGYFLYQRINQFTVDYFYRDPSGAETMQPNESIEWAVYDHQRMLFDSGSGATSANGWFQFLPALPENYVGRIEVVVSATGPNGALTDSSMRYAGNEAGVFGIVDRADTGTITITPLNDHAAPVKTDVINGAFSAPSLAALRGRFRAVFRNSAGVKISKQFTKDASDYFLSIQGGR